MIVPGLSEDKILEELVSDRKFIANEAKKIARKQILRLQKGGRDGINELLDFNYEIKVGGTNNRWRLVILINMAKRVKWYHQAACYMESEYGTKDYYVLRGLSNEKPYFIKISSHALKRFRERAIEERFGVHLSFNGDVFVPLIFRKGEIITWMKIIDPVYWKFLYDPDCEGQNVLTNLYYTYFGIYLGYRTEGGNYEFKTFLRNNIKLKSDEENMIKIMCKVAHAGLNRRMYIQADIDTIQNCGDEDIIECFNHASHYKFQLVP